MHIVYISREYPPSRRGGGIASYVRIMAEGFAARGHQVTVVAASDDTMKVSDEAVNGVRVVRLSGGDFCLKEAEPQTGMVEKFRFLYRFHSYRRKIRETVVRMGKVDVMEVAEFGAEGLYLNDLNIPVVYRLHTPDLLDHLHFCMKPLTLGNAMYYYGGRKELEVLKKYGRHVTSCSTSLKDWAVKYVGMDAESIQVIYNPVQNDFLSSQEEVEIVKHRVFFAGTICDWKGAGDLVETCGILQAMGMPVSLEMAGKIGSYGEALKAKYSGASWLKILGKRPQSELKRLYAASGVVCFPSWWENMPMVCIEAMALGAVVIGSNSGGMAEIIEDGVSGFLLPPHCPEVWAVKIREVLALSDEERMTISQNAKKRIREVFALEKILDETEQYYQSIK